MDVVSGSIVQSLISLAIILILICFIQSAFRGSETRQYRKKLTDMYVAGKIRQLAKAENIIIEDELKEYIKLTKHEKKFMQDLDDSIEMDMKTKLEEESRVIKQTE